MTGVCVCVCVGDRSAQRRYHRRLRRLTETLRQSWLRGGSEVSTAERASQSGASQLPSPSPHAHGGLTGANAPSATSLSPPRCS